MERDERVEHLLRECRDIVARRLAEVPPEGSPGALLDTGEEPDDAVVAALRAAPRVTPRPAFRAAARERLLARIAVTPPPQPQRLQRQHLVPRVAMRVAASVAIVFSLTSGAIVASANSLPDEPLYVVKTVVEEAQLRAALDPEERVRLHLRFAKRRIAELEAASDARPAAAAAATERYERELRAAAEVLRAAPDLARDPVVASVEGELRQHEAALHEVLQRAPAEVRPAVVHALEVSRQGREYVERVKAGETAPPLAPPQPVSAAPTPPQVASRPALPVATRPPADAEATATATPLPVIVREGPPRPLPGSIGDVRPVPAPPAPDGAKTAPGGDAAKDTPPMHILPDQPVLGVPWPQPIPTAGVRREPPVVTAEQRGPVLTATVQASTVPTAPVLPSPTPTAVVVPPLPITPLPPEAPSATAATTPTTHAAPAEATGAATAPAAGATPVTATAPVSATAPGPLPGSAAGSSASDGASAGASAPPATPGAANSQPPEWRRTEEAPALPPPTPTPSPARP